MSGIEIQAQLRELQIENAQLKDQLAQIRGAIEELAIGAVPAHWAHHFVVVNAMDKTQHAVPWEWVGPPFQLVKEKMDAMGDFGTRAVKDANELHIFQPAADRYYWLASRGEAHFKKSLYGPWYFSHAKLDKHGWAEKMSQPTR